MTETYNYRGRAVIEFTQLTPECCEMRVIGPYTWQGATPADARDRACANLQAAINWMLELDLEGVSRAQSREGR